MFDHLMNWRNELDKLKESKILMTKRPIKCLESKLFTYIVQDQDLGIEQSLSCPCLPKDHTNGTQLGEAAGPSSSECRPSDSKKSFSLKRILQTGIKIEKVTYNNSQLLI